MADTLSRFTSKNLPQTDELPEFLRLSTATRSLRVASSKTLRIDVVFLGAVATAAAPRWQAGSSGCWYWWESSAFVRHR